MSDAREKTAVEIRDELLGHVRVMVSFWNTAPNAGSQRDRLDGLAFSIFTAIDGCAGGLTGGFHLVPTCHESDPGYLSREGCNWWPVNAEAIEAAKGCPTSLGMLHEAWVDAQ